MWNQCVSVYFVVVLLFMYACMCIYPIYNTIYAFAH